MNKKAWKAGAVSALAVGAGLAAAASKRKKAGKVVKSASDYRNTERGSQEKNSKGIYYSKGNYEAFARPEKPAGIEGKSAYIVGSGLGFLAAGGVFFVLHEPITLPAVLGIALIFAGIVVLNRRSS